MQELSLKSAGDVSADDLAQWSALTKLDQVHLFYEGFNAPFVIEVTAAAWKHLPVKLLVLDPFFQQPVSADVPHHMSGLTQLISLQVAHGEISGNACTQHKTALGHMSMLQDLSLSSVTFEPGDQDCCRSF